MDLPCEGTEWMCDFTLARMVAPVSEMRIISFAECHICHHLAVLLNQSWKATWSVPLTIGWCTKNTINSSNVFDSQMDVGTTQYHWFSQGYQLVNSHHFHWENPNQVLISACWTPCGSRINRIWQLHHRCSNLLFPGPGKLYKVHGLSVIARHHPWIFTMDS